MRINHLGFWSYDIIRRHKIAKHLRELFFLPRHAVWMNGWHISRIWIFLARTLAYLPEMEAVEINGR